MKGKFNFVTNHMVIGRNRCHLVISIIIDENHIFLKTQTEFQIKCNRITFLIF